MMSNKFHWYLMVYSDGNVISTRFMGRKSKTVTRLSISENQSSTDVAENMILLSCSYLGYMTKDLFDPPDQPNDSNPPEITP